MSTSVSPTTSTSSQPISIDPNNAHNPNRKRSASVWSNPGLSPSASPVSSTMSLQTPSSIASSLPRQGQGSPTSPTSPLSFFLGSSPVKPTFGFSGTASQKNSSFLDGSAVVEDDDTGPRTAFGHSRGGSMNWPTSGHDRAAGVLRRLSLSGALGGVRPTAVQPPSPPRAHTPPQLGLRRDSNETVQAIDRAPSPRPRANKKLASPNKKRSVSPMGERILKGHFDGFGL